MLIDIITIALLYPAFCWRILLRSNLPHNQHPGYYHIFFDLLNYRMQLRFIASLLWNQGGFVISIKGLLESFKGPFRTVKSGEIRLQTDFPNSSYTFSFIFRGLLYFVNSIPKFIISLMKSFKDSPFLIIKTNNVLFLNTSTLGTGRNKPCTTTIQCFFFHAQQTLFFKGARGSTR